MVDIDIALVFQLITLAILLEALVNSLKLIWDPTKRTVEFWVSLGVGLALSIGVNVLAGLDIFAILGVPLRFPIISVILTGVLLSRGSQFIHDIFKVVYELKESIKLRNFQPPPEDGA